MRAPSPEDHEKPAGMISNETMPHFDSGPRSGIRLANSEAIVGLCECA